MRIAYDTIETPVIFRIWPNGAITALFPTQPSDTLGRYCAAYELPNGEAEYDYDTIMERTLAAEPREYRALASIVHSYYGYKVWPVNRATDQMHRERRREATAARRQRMNTVRVAR
jgi:hypothetical protein